MASELTSIMFYLGISLTPLLIIFAVIMGLLALSPKVRASGWLRIAFTAAACATIITCLLLGPAMLRNVPGWYAAGVEVLSYLPTLVVDALMPLIGDDDPVVLIGVYPVVTWLELIVVFLVIGGWRRNAARRSQADEARLTRVSSGSAPES